MKSMFKLRRPCAHCPFRTDVDGYLRRERASSIAAELAGGAIFYCHETTVDDPDDDGERIAGTESQFCAGALIMLEHCEAPNQAMRTAERLGIYDPAKMRMDAPVHQSAAAFVLHHGTDEEEHECCSVCDPGCEAPAGMMINGVAVPSEVEVDLGRCPECGEPVCESCAVEGGRCPYCASWDDKSEAKNEAEVA